MCTLPSTSSNHCIKFLNFFSQQRFSTVLFHSFISFSWTWHSFDSNRKFLISSRRFSKRVLSGKRKICLCENLDLTLFSNNSTTSSRHVIPSTHNGVWADWDTSNKLYSKVWLWCVQNRSNSSRTQTTLFEVRCSPVRKQASKNARFSAKLPKTFPSTAFSKFICTATAFKARRSSVWTKPFNRTNIAFCWNSFFSSSSTLSTSYNYYYEKFISRKEKSDNSR